MREIDCQKIKEKLVMAILRAEYMIDPEIASTIRHHEKHETSRLGKWVLNQLSENYDIAKNEQIAICQDTGMCILFASVG